MLTRSFLRLLPPSRPHHVLHISVLAPHDARFACLSLPPPLASGCCLTRLALEVSSRYAAHMGRASRAKRERRKATVGAQPEPPKPKGGRPRIHDSNAAKHRAFRLRKKLGITGEAHLGLPDGGNLEVEDDWFEEAEYDRWLLSAAAQLGPEWLEQYLEIEAEARDAEEERVPAT